jgi:uncharacterized protein
VAVGAQVINNADAGRYEVSLDGKPAGFAEYRLRDGRVIFTHTEVDSTFEGHGLGSSLARGALDDVRDRGLQAVPLCPFIAAYIERHPEYQDLVAG